MSKSFQIIFEETDGTTYSATFDTVISPECKGKFVDVKGKVYDMGKYHRTLDSESTSLNIIHYAKNLDSYCKCKDPDCGWPSTCEDINDQCAYSSKHCAFSTNVNGCICKDGKKECRSATWPCSHVSKCPAGMQCLYPSGHHCHHNGICGACACAWPPS